MMQLFKTPNIDFIKLAKTCVTISGLLVGASLLLLAIVGKDALGFDFKGGTAVSIRMNDDVNIEDVRGRIRGIKDAKGNTKYEDAEVQIMVSVGEGNLSDVATFGKKTAKQFQIRTAYGDKEELKRDLLKVFSDKMNPDAFIPLDLAEAPPERTMLYDRPIAGGFSIYIRGKAETLDSAAFRKYFEGLAASYVGRESSGQPYLLVKEAGRHGVFTRFDVYLAPVSDAEFQKDKDSAKAAAVAQGKNIESAFREAKAPEFILPETPFVADNHVGPAVAQEMKNSTIWALIISWILMIVYIWVRFFSFPFGAAAVIALIHDSLISLGAVLLMFIIVPKGLGLSFDLSLATVAAILTIIGYSVNDTIVVYDRIRENIHLMKRASFAEIINASVNQTLSRTVLTSLTAWISVVCLYIFTMTSSSGVSGLSFPMIVGFVVGTYSSIYIAAPILAWWYKGQRPQLEKA
jgi:SecD/SecF fusion protein